MTDIRQESIIAYSEKILNHLLEFKKTHRDFTFCLRQRNSSQKTEVKRLESGMWFQGSDYILVPLFRAGDDAQKIKTFGFVINLDKSGEIISSSITISFKAGVDNENEKEFHRMLAAKLGIKLNNHNIGDKFFENPNDIFNNLDYYLNDARNVALSLLKEFNLSQKYEFTEAQFDKMLLKVNQIKSENLKISSGNNVIPLKILNVSHPLNQILYGPPGTGKTYNTVLEAAKIVSGRNDLKFDEALKIFNANLKDQIEFITFHQNFSYEDFIQGLRPDIKQGNHLSFERKDGVFKSISDRALKNIELSEKAPEDLSNEVRFDKALEDFKDHILDSEDKYAINDAVHIFEIDEDAFRYTGANWESNATGIRMKFSDLKEFYRSNVKTRKDIKALTNVSGVARQHATYYLLVYQAILKFLPIKAEKTLKVEKKNYVIIIDEINRANISRVFGELITLIEEDKRSGGKIPMIVTLPSGDNFIVPSNLYIIGTMNTADKSIALLDIALRRRFEFVPMYPKYEIEGKNIYFPEVLKSINEKICKLKTRDFQIGHAYFMENDNLEHIMNRKVIPLLLEYFMNDEKTVKDIITANDCTIDTDCWPMKFSKN